MGIRARLSPLDSWSNKNTLVVTTRMHLNGYELRKTEYQICLIATKYFHSLDKNYLN